MNMNMNITLKNKTRYAACFLLLTVAVFFSGCAGQKEPNATPITLDVSALGQKLAEELSLTGELSPVEAEVFAYLYDITPEHYTESRLLLASGAVADEICIIKAADENSKNIIKEKITARLAAQKENFASYLPQEVAKLDNALLLEQDDYLILVVCNQPEQAKELIESAIAEAKEAK